MRILAYIVMSDVIDSADYNAVLEEKGAIQIENHSDFDVHWRQQQQVKLIEKKIVSKNLILGKNIEKNSCTRRYTVMMIRTF